MMQGDAMLDKTYRGCIKWTGRWVVTPIHKGASTTVLHLHWDNIDNRSFSCFRVKVTRQAMYG